MGDEPKFSEKWDFRRQENNFDDSSSDDPDSNPLLHNPNLVLDSNQTDNGTKTESTEQPTETRKRRCKKDSSKPEEAKRVRRKRPKTIFVEENTKKKERVVEDDEVGMFMKTLLDDLTASRDSLMDWMMTELYRTNQNVAEDRGVAAEREVKKKMTKRKKECKPEMNKPKEKSSQISQNEVQEHKSIVLAIEAPNLSQRQKKTREAKSIKQRSSIGLETLKDNNFVIPNAPPSFPHAPSLFPSGQGNSNDFQLVQQPPSDLSEFQTGFGSSLFNNNSYFPEAFQPNLIAGGYNFSAQMNASTSSKDRENDNMFRGLRTAGGAVRFSGIGFHQAEVGDGNNGLPDYRTSSGR